MSSKQAVALGVRLFVIWIVIMLLHYIPGSLGFIERYRGDSMVGLGLFLASAAASIIICLVLWFFPLTIAGSLLQGADLPPAQPASADEWFSVGCRLLGLWGLTQTVPALLFYYVPVWIVSKRPDFQAVWDTNIKWNIVRLIAELAIGVWLLFGAKGLLGILRRARTAGQ